MLGILTTFDHHLLKTRKDGKNQRLHVWTG